MSSSVQGTGHPMMNKTELVPPNEAFIAEHIKKPSGGLKCLCTAPAWVSLKLAVTVTWAQEGPGGEQHQTASSASTRRLGSCEQPQKGVSLTGLILAPTPPPSPPAVPPYRQVSGQNWA